MNIFRGTNWEGTEAHITSFRRCEVKKLEAKRQNVKKRKLSHAEAAKQVT